MRIKNLFLIMVVATLVLTGCGPFQKLLKSEDPMAQYTSAMDYYKNGKYDRAMTLLGVAMSPLMGTEYEDTILFTMGKILYLQNDYEVAGQTMDEYRNKFPRTTFTPEAEYIYAMSFYMSSYPVEKDQTNTRKAIVAFNEYMNRYPESEFIPEIQKLSEEMNEKLYYKAFVNASLYYDLDYYLAAITSLKALLKDNPETPYKEEAMYLICKSWFDYANNSINTRQLDRYLKMIDSYFNFKTSFPDSKQYGSELEKMRLLSQEFVDNNGATSQSLETSTAKVEAAKARIEKSKDAMFYAKTKEGRDKIRAVMKEDRETIKREKENVKVEAKILRDNQKAEREKLRILEKEAKEARKLEKKAEAELKKQKREEFLKHQAEIKKLDQEARDNN